MPWQNHKGEEFRDHTCHGRNMVLYGLLSFIPWWESLWWSYLPQLKVQRRKLRRVDLCPSLRAHARRKMTDALQVNDDDDDDDDPMMNYCWIIVGMVCYNYLSVGWCWWWWWWWASSSKGGISLQAGDADQEIRGAAEPLHTAVRPVGRELGKVKKVMEFLGFLEGSAHN